MIPFMLASVALREPQYNRGCVGKFLALRDGPRTRPSATSRGLHVKVVVAGTAGGELESILREERLLFDDLKQALFLCCKRERGYADR
jgi:hypothetical protein